MIAKILAVTAAALALAGPAAACAHPKTSLSFLEGQIMCPTCHTTLDMSEAPAAQQIKAQIAKRIAQCWSAKQIEDELVGNFGQGILAAPPHKGFDLLAWWLPLGGVLLGAVLRLVVAFVAGYASVVTPCVLPLVPGYLSAVSGVDPDELGRAGAARRVVVASIPFILGFTLVFVVVGAGAAAISNVVTPSAQADVAGFVLVVLGLAFVGLLPVPERVIAPGLLAGARKRGSRALLGGAFAVCAAPCIGSVLAAVLVLASNSSTILKGALLLAVRPQLTADQVKDLLTSTAVDIAPAGKDSLSGFGMLNVAAAF